MSWRRVWRSQLARRIYLISLAQIVVVGLGLWAIMRLNRPVSPDEHRAQEQATVSRVSALFSSPEKLKAHLESERDERGIVATVLDGDGNVVASTAPADAQRCAPPFRPHHRHGEHRPPRPRLHREGHPPPRRLCRFVSLSLPDGETGWVEFRRTKPQPPSPINAPVIVLTLVVVGVSSYLLARSLVKPLGQLANAARTLGSGDLTARARLKRSDELGEVGDAFDEMADQMTDLVRAERELVANVSHELRTPLARIRVALDIAAEGDAADVRESLTDITGDLDELERLVSDVLMTARLDLHASHSPRGIPPLRREVISPSSLARQAEQRFCSAHPNRPLSVSCPGDLPTLEGDEVLLRRVLDNLLENAHKYTEDPDEVVELSVRPLEDHVVFEVRDRGIGISEEDLRDIFRPFFRADRSRTRSTGGLGLGLALVKRIVDAHGGHVELESTLDAGTVARVLLPIQE